MANLGPALAGMLAAIEAGDAAVIGMLADWLDERGDPRAALAREATQIDVEAVATLLHVSRHEPPGGFWVSREYRKSLKNKRN